MDYLAVAALIEDLPRLTREARRERGRTLYDAAAEMDLQPSALSRFENSTRVATHTRTTLRVLRWLALDQSHLARPTDR